MIEKNSKVFNGIKFNKNKNEFDKRIHKLVNLNPMKILERGYSVVSSENKVIKKLEDVDINEVIDIKISDGIIKGIVKEKIYEENTD